MSMSHDMAPPNGEEECPSVSHVAALPRDVPLVLFGAGQGGRLVRRAAARRHHIRIAGFLDNHKQSDFMDGLPVWRLEEFLEAHPPNARIIITSQYRREIGGQLHAAGIREYLDASPLVERLVRRRAALAQARRPLVYSAALLPVVILFGWILLHR